ncbi:MAG: phosphotransferase [Candidatus Accumulibacter sp.]|nr:phosphotransferase [Accumulibacter sp.]
MRIVAAQALEDWLKNGRILEKDARGPKVVALESGSESGLFLKIFHTRRHPLLARLQPAAPRFAKNAQCLKKLGIPVPEIIDSFWIPANPLTGRKCLSACLYRPLPGITLESLFRQDPEALYALLPDLARFIRRIHRKRIYFRSLHVGNILSLPDGGFGLIDVLDLKRCLLPLGRWRIRRNFRHLTRHLARSGLDDFPASELCRLYYGKLT